MTLTKTKQMIFVFVLAVIMLFGIVLSAVPNYAYAETQKTEFEKTNVLTDLQSSTVNGQPFDISKYPFNEDKDISVVNFVEYCYSYKRNLQLNYGLYVYIYNPKGLNLSTSSKSNKIQMAVKYDEEGKPTDYVKFSLEFCNKSEHSDYKNLFYKFKVIDKAVDGTTFYERVNSNARRYDISGIELTTYGEPNATDYYVGGTYTFTGYAEGYGPDSTAKDTLACSINYLETVKLDVFHTFYRTKTSIKGAGYQNQLDTVYFAVPKRFFELYGKLQRIKAEWYEYKTKDIVVTSNKDFYNKVDPYLGVATNPKGNLGIPAYNKQIYYSLGQNAGSKGGGFWAADWGYNLGDGYLHTACQTLYYLFHVDNIKSYDPYADVVKNGGVSSNALYEYIMNYKKTHNNGYLPIKEGRISADLFENDIDDYRKMDNEFGKIQHGYSYYDFDADVDLQKLSSWSEGNPTFWDNWKTWGFLDALLGRIPDEASRTVSPIYTLKESDLKGTPTEVAERLLINVNDVDDLKAFYKDAVEVSGKDDEEKVVVLFRFATSDYYSAEVDIIEIGAGALNSDKHRSGQAYRAWESVFMDFDIIQLTFNRDGVYTVIPVVSSPIDIVNAITPPVQVGELEWWKMVLAIILLILLLIILYPILPYIIKFIVWVIMLPVKLIASIFKRKERKREKEE